MEYNVQLTREHLERNGKIKDTEALKEVIWNAFDADAKNIVIVLHRNNLIDTDKITEINVVDDGIGLDFSGIGKALVQYGKSEKSYTQASPSGRRYHGKLGEGRYTYFSIGNSISWVSNYEKNGDLYQFEVNFSSSSPRIVVSEEKKSDATHAGLCVNISDLNPTSSNDFINRNLVMEELTKEFSPYLLAYKTINISYDNLPLNVQSHIQFEKKYSCSILNHIFTLSIVKWKNIGSGEVFYSGNGDVVYKHESLEGIDSTCTVYIQSTFFDEAKINGQIEVLNMVSLNEEVISFVWKSYASFLNENELSMNQNFIEELKTTGLYPYKSEPTDFEEQEQKKIFDVVVIQLDKISTKIRCSNKETKKFTYKLINEAIKTNPSSLRKIIDEVFKLSHEQQVDFALLLEKTSMAAIVSTMKEVTDRICFLEELNKLVYSDEGKNVKERTQFQKLLLSQVWIFGDQYVYGTDDVNLRNVLKAHLKHLDLTDISLTDDDNSNTDFNKIPDIVLWNNQKSGSKFENLVVEIKRPTKILGESELSQIKNYAFSIVRDGRFSIKNTKWRFILIGQKIDDFVANELKNTEHGYIDGKGFDYIIEVLSWADLIGANKLRYEYFKEKAKLDLTDKNVVDSLQNRWAKVLGKDKAPH